MKHVEITIKIGIGGVTERSSFMDDDYDDYDDYDIDDTDLL